MTLPVAVVNGMNLESHKLLPLFTGKKHHFYLTIVLAATAVQFVS